jgi:hypothetical protein
MSVKKKSDIDAFIIRLTLLHYSCLFSNNFERKRVTLYFAQVDVCVISGLCHEVDEIWTLLGYYAAYNGNSLEMFWVNISDPSSRGETDQQFDQKRQ